MNRPTTLAKTSRKRRRSSVSFMDTVASKNTEFVASASFNMPEKKVNVQQEFSHDAGLPGAQALEAIGQEMQNYAKALELIKTLEDRVQGLESKNEDLATENQKLRDLLVDAMLKNNSAGGQRDQGDDCGVIKASNS